MKRRSTTKILSRQQREGRTFTTSISTSSRTKHYSVEQVLRGFYLLLAITAAAAAATAEMTDIGTSGSGGLALDQYSATLPPGWRPGLTHFPFRRYLERMRLWYRMNTLHPSQLGPAVAGRLQGKPFNMAMRLRITVRDGRTLVGDHALAYEGLPEDLTNGITAAEAGLQMII